MVCLTGTTAWARSIDDLSLTERVALAIYNTSNPADAHTPDNVGSIVDKIVKDDPDSPRKWTYKFYKTFGEYKAPGYFGIRKTNLKKLKKPKGEGWYELGIIQSLGGKIWFRQNPRNNGKYDEIRVDCLESGYQLAVAMRRPIGENRDTARKEMVSRLESFYKNADHYQVFDRIKLYLELNRELEADEQMTPGDKVSFRLKLENNSPKKIFGVKVLLSCVEEARDHNVLRFTDKPDQTWFDTDAGEINPGRNHTFEDVINVEIADEKNKWIQKYLIKGEPGAIAKREKPSPELSVEHFFHARVKVAYTPGSYEDLMDKPIPFRKKGDKKNLALTYPDLSEIAGTPTSGDVEEADYHRRGDRNWCHLNDENIRTVAIRAARYNVEAPGGQYYGEFPDDAGTVAHNIADFVYDALMPKDGESGIHLDFSLAKMVLDGEIVPENAKEQEKRTKPKFICSSHSLFFGALLRSLGFCVREANMTMNLRIARSYYQDAASQAWFDNDWQFFALWPGPGPRLDPKDYYGFITPTYNMWVGVKPYVSTETDPKKHKSRFNMSKDQMNASPCWRYEGWGDSDGFFPGVDLATPAAQKPKPLMVYTLRSLITGILTQSDGKRIGASKRIDPNNYKPFMKHYKQGFPGLISEIKNAWYYPEDLPVYPIAGDPAAMIKLPQLIIVRVSGRDDNNGHTLTITGIDNGHFQVNADYIDPEGKQHHIGSYHSEITAGERMTIKGSDFHSPAAVPAVKLPAPEESGESGEWKTIVD